MIDLAHVMRQPHELQDHLDGLVVELDSISSEQDGALQDIDSKREEWEEVFDDFCDRLQNEYDAGDLKGTFPGKDRLESMARRETHAARDAWRALRRAESRVERANRRASNVREQISGLQSELRTVEAEARAPRPRHEPEGHTFGAKAA